MVTADRTVKGTKLDRLTKVAKSLGSKVEVAPQQG